VWCKRGKKKKKDCSRKGTCSHTLNAPKDFIGFGMVWDFLFWFVVIFFKIDSDPCIETVDTVVLP